MPVMHEDFIRCSCGNADFKEDVVVTLPTGLKPRYINEKHIAHPTLDRKVEYICTNCGKKQEI